MTEVPFAIGEAFTSKWDWLPFIEENLVDLARIDIANVGGFTEAMKVAALCEAHYIEMMPHLAISPIQTATIIHFAAAVRNFAWMEDRHRDSRALVEGKRSSYRPPDSSIYSTHLEPDGVRWPVPTCPGLGVEINEEMLEAPRAVARNADAAPGRFVSDIADNHQIRLVAHGRCRYLEGPRSQLNERNPLCRDFN